MYVERGARVPSFGADSMLRETPPLRGSMWRKRNQRVGPWALEIPRRAGIHPEEAYAKSLSEAAGTDPMQATPQKLDYSVRALG